MFSNHFHSKDFCQLLNADQPYWLLGMTEMTRALCLELMEEVLTNYTSVFLKVYFHLNSHHLSEIIWKDCHNMHFIWYHQLNSLSSIFGHFIQHLATSYLQFDHVSDIIIVVITLASRVHLSAERKGLPPCNKALFPEHQVQGLQGKQQSFCLNWHWETLLSHCHQTAQDCFSAHSTLLHHIGRFHVRKMLKLKNYECYLKTSKI